MKIDFTAPIKSVSDSGTSTVTTIRTCYSCGVDKPLSDFCKDKHKALGHAHQCKSCRTEFRNRPEEKIKQQERRSHKKHKDPRGVLLSAAKSRAKAEGLPFSLVISDLYIPPVCPVLGIPLEVGTVANRDYSPSIDRIIPELGYTAKNTQIISYRANMIKNNATLDELRRVAAFVHSLENKMPIVGGTFIKVYLDTKEGCNG